MAFKVAGRDMLKGMLVVFIDATKDVQAEVVGYVVYQEKPV